MLRQYSELFAKVRGNGQYHPIKPLVQPNLPIVQQLADILVQDRSFVGAAQDFICAFTAYRDDLGDYWATPEETMEPLCPVCVTGIGLVSLPGYRFDKQEYNCKICGYTGLPLRAGDCDDKAILLCSILRNFYHPWDVYCAIGTWNPRGTPIGHMWILLNNKGADRLIESTQSSSSQTKGTYELGAMFNDKYALASEWGLEEFGLRAAPLPTRR